jgi:predicted DNA-binding transcriptional regulator YafY
MWVVSDADRVAIDVIERAVESHDVISIDYQDEQGEHSQRDVRPLGLWFWGRVWTLACWCELRNDFRTFRIDRIKIIGKAERRFKPEKGKLLSDFYRAMEKRKIEQGGMGLRYTA